MSALGKLASNMDAVNNEKVIAKLITEKGKSYWDNNGAYTELFDKVWKENVPSQGGADNVHGELVRSFGRLNYDYGNNGNCNVLDVHNETCHNCDGSGWEQHECDTCGGDGWVYEEDETGEETQVDCNHCDNGYNELTCYECDGEGVTGVEILIDKFYQNCIDFIDDYIDRSIVAKLTDFLLDKNNGYGQYTFDDSEMKVYNDVADAIGYFISTHPNRKLQKHEIYSAIIKS